MNEIANKYKRDFNIINNEYKVFNKEKKETEDEIQNLTAMKKMQNRKTYDLLNCKYINPNLENEFLKELEHKNKLWLSKTKDRNFIIRNPINNIIYDKEGQNKLDDIEERKRKRYKAHEKIEQFYHSIGNNKEIHKNKMSLSHGNPLDLNYKNKRGYDIISGKNYIDKNTIQSKNDNKCEDIHMLAKKEGQYYDNWEKIKLKVDENNTISMKPIYKEPYDCTDVDKNFKKYIQNRRRTLLSINSPNIMMRNYDTFKNLNNQSGGPKKSNNNRINYYNNNKTNNGYFQKSSSQFINSPNNIIKYEMDKNKFFGNSYLVKK